MRRSHRKAQEEAELNITPFMNLMVVLVPVLLLSLVFSHLSIIDLRLPNAAGAAAQPDDKDKWQLEVIIRENQVELADTKAGILYDPDTKQKAIFPLKGTEFDKEKLSGWLQMVKRRVPDKKDISILAETDTPYQVIVSVMDTVRSYEAVVVASVVDAELFPDVSLGDAPPAATKGGK